MKSKGKRVILYYFIFFLFEEWIRILSTCGELKSLIQYFLFYSLFHKIYPNIERNVYYHSLFPHTKHLISVTPRKENKVWEKSSLDQGLGYLSKRYDNKL